MATTEARRIGELATLLKGRKPSSVADRQVNGALPYLLIEGFEGDYSAFTNDPGCVRCLPDDVVIVADGANTGLTTTGHDAYLGSTLAALRVNQRSILPRFLYYFVRVCFHSLNTQTRGATIPHLEKSLLLDLEVPLLHLEEQNRIVRILDEADALRNLRQRADERARDFPSALFVEMFGHPLENPHGFPTAPLTALCNPKQWPTISGPELTESGYPVFGANGIIGFYSSFNHEVPTVLVTCRGATCGTINVSTARSYVTGNAMALDNPDEKRITPSFLEWSLRVRGFGDAITGAAQPQITRKNLEPITLPVPPLSLQRDFETKTMAFRELEGNQSIAKQRLETLFESLLARAFRGEL